MVANLQDSSVPYGSGALIKTYLQNNTRHITTEPIKEYIMLRTGQMSRNTDHAFDFSIYESPIRPLSLYLSTNSTSQENLKITINNLQGQPPAQVFFFDLGRNDIPYVFPPIILFPFSQVVLRPRYDVFNCYIICESCGNVIVDDVFNRPT